MKSITLAVVLIALVQVVQITEAFVVNVDAHNEECFFEKIEGGTKFSKLQSYNKFLFCNMFLLLASIS